MLNQQQNLAVDHIGSPLMIFAGPGTGKTLTLQSKYQNYINEHNISPRKILCLSFSNAAANELRKRIIQNIKIDQQKIKISTFHSFCYQIVRSNPEECKLLPRFSILGPDNQEKRIYELLNMLGISWNTKYLPSIRETISKTKRQQEWDNTNPTYQQKLAIEVYEHYQWSLKDNNEIDLDDMIIKTNRMFKNYPEILKEYQQHFSHILIDEAQDMDHNQYSLIQHLNCKNTTLVGDDDQSIYGFNGASHEYLQKFVEDFNATTITLENNYRSTKKIVKASSDLITNNKNRQPKEIFTENSTGKNVKILISPNEESEANNVAKICKNKQNCAILYRKNIQSEHFENALQKESVPYKIIGGTGFYARRDIKDALAVLTLTITNDEEAFRRALNTQHGIGEVTINTIIAYANERGMSYLDACSAKLTGINESKHANLCYFQNAYKRHTKPKELIRELLPTTNKKEQKRIKTLIKNIDNWQESLETFIEYTSTLEKADNCITLMTFHKSKGLEYDTVIITGFEQGLIPHSSTIYENEADIEEERRLAYVAISRAKKDIYISCSQERFINNERIQQYESQFLKEIPKELKEYI